MNDQTLLDKMKDNSITNEELILGLNAGKHNVIGRTILAIIERKYCNEQVILKLAQLGSLLQDHLLIGPYQIGHMAIAALYLIDNDEARPKYYDLFNTLNERDKFFVENFIEQYTKKPKETAQN